jgi:hypothetical protein
MLVTANKFAEASKTVRLKLLIDQKVQKLALKAGDVVEVPAQLARFLKNIGRAEDAPAPAKDAVANAVSQKPVVANR